MKGRTLGGLAIAAFWVGSCGLAFWIGRESEARGTRGSRAVATSQATVAPGGTGFHPDRAAGADSDAAREDAAVSGIRKGGSVGRFIGYTWRLSADELARLLPEMTEAMTLADVERAMRRLREELPPGPARQLARFELIDRWGQLDAPAAFTELENEGDVALRAELTKRAIKGWASVDPAAAHAWVQTTPDLPAEALRAIWWGIADTKDLAKTLEFVPSLGPGSNSYSEPHQIWDIYMTLHEWYAKDDKLVTGWVEELPEGDVRTRAMHSMIDQWARHDPRAAKDWVDENASDADKTEAYVEIAESWARHEPEAAVEWAATLPADTPDLRRIYERMFARFLQYDYRDAANYLVAQEPSPALDTAFEVYIDEVKSIDPAASMAWAESITDEARRMRAMGDVAGIWRGKDRAALESYVEGSEFSEAQRDILLGK